MNEEKDCEMCDTEGCTHDCANCKSKVQKAISNI